MFDVLTYIAIEVKSGRLQKDDALQLFKLVRRARGERAIATLHPLLQTNTSNLSEQRFSSTFSGAEFYLADHIVQGNRVLPGVCYLEMARAAVNASLNQLPDSVAIALKNVVWSQPVIVNTAIDVHIGLHSQENGEIEFQIYTRAPETNKPDVVHAQGRAILIGATSAAAIESTDLALWRRLCTQSIKIDRCYEAFSAMGLDYGSAHRGLTDVQVGADDSGQRFVLATVTLPECINETHAQYILHPSVLDSALQASIGLSLVDAELVGSRPALPFALDRLEIFDRSPTNAIVVVKPSARRGGVQGDGRIQKLDVDICDESGRVCVRFSGFSSRRLERELVSSKQVQHGTEMLLVAPSWVRKSLSPALGVATEYDERVLFVDAMYREWMIELERSCSGLQVEVLEPPAGDLRSEISAAAEQVFTRVQLLLKSKPKRLVLVQVVLADQNIGRALATALSGLLRSASQENAKFIGQVIRVAPSAGIAEFSRLLAENASEAAQRDAEIRYVDGVREVASFKAIVVKSEIAASSRPIKPWKDGGVYLITGGAGGLGLIFAKEIAGQVEGAQVVLTGRSELSVEKQAQLTALQLSSRSARIMYRVLDVSDASAVTMCINAVAEQCGSLNGVIHSAGVIRDNFIINKTVDEFSAVLAPKVSGTLNVDLATQDFALDFFILFSSVSGVFGNVGQSDYAFANGFMDTYAGYRNELVEQKRRHGRTLSIDWPLWANGGMRINEASQNVLRRHGMYALSTSMGLEAMYQAWQSGEAQVIALAGEVQKLKRLVGLIVPSNITPTRNLGVAQVASNSIDEVALLEKIEGALMAAISQQLKVRVEDIDEEAELSEFGFDSISLTVFGNTLNALYGLSLSPTIFFEYPTVRSFALYLRSEHAAILVEMLGVVALRKVASQSELVGVAVNDVAVTRTAMGFQHERSRGRGFGVIKHGSAPVQQGDEIAIIGMSGRFPGAGDVDAFWENLRSGQDSITEIPADRWDWRSLFGDPSTQANKTNIKWGGFIEGMAEFDPLFFNIAPKEAELMDPQQRLLLLYSWKAIEDAGYAPQSLSGTKTGVFVGTGSSGYSELISRSSMAIEGYSSTGAVPSVGPNRVSFLLNLHGPSEPIETACSSSLVAIHRAVRAMQSGDCEMALVGGINTIVTPWAHISFSKAGMLSADGKCKTFSKDANGYVRGEGVGMLFLKKLSSAERAGDHIYGKIKGSAENHGGRATSLTAPNPKAQAELIKSAYREAQLDPCSVTYIETHGTGTPLGDPIEINGLRNAFADLYADRDAGEIKGSYCGLGSVKTNIGHLELAAGVAGVIKVLLQLKHKTLVKSLHCEELNPHIQLTNTPFYIVNETQPWAVRQDAAGRDMPRRAGVSSFGFGGVNAHVIIEEYCAVASQVASLEVTAEKPALIVLSAKNLARLQEQVQQLLTHLTIHSVLEADLAGIAYTLQVGREAMEHRLAFAVTTLSGLQEKLTSYLAGKYEIGAIAECYRGETKKNKEALSVFTTDEDLQHALSAWLEKGKYTKLLEMWVKGLNFDWSRLYGEVHPQRLSLPTYPFARERYWVEACASQSAIAAVADRGADETPADEWLAEDSVETEQPPRNIALPMERLLFAEAWQLQAVEAARPLVGFYTVAVLLSDPQRQAALQSMLAKIDPQIRALFIVQRSIAAEVSSARYGVFREDKASYAEVFQSVVATHGALDAVWYLWGLEDASCLVDQSPIVHVIQGLASAGIKQAKVLLAAEYGSALERCYVESWIGYERSLRQVLPEMQVAVLHEHQNEAHVSDEAETSADSVTVMERWAQRLWTETQAEQTESVLYCAADRQVLRTHPIKIASAVAPAAALRHGGTYLITGGLGGLGYVFAEHLARCYAANLILVGRSSIDAQKETQLHALARLGGQTLYVMADVGDRDQMQRALDQGLERFGVLHGVLHAAGIESRTNVLSKEWSAIEAVLLPKIGGTIVLGELLAAHALDFVCYFSSTSAALGDFGSCDYAVGNRFELAYAKYVNRNALAICWPLWADGGMGFKDQEATQLYLQSSGQRALPAVAGVEIFEQLLVLHRSGLEHALVLLGERPRVYRMLGLTPPVNEFSQRQGHINPRRRPELQGLSIDDCVLWELKELASELLKLAREKLDVDENLAAFGFDSIGLAGFAKRLSSHFSVVVLPSVFFSHATLTKLAVYFLTEHAAAIRDQYIDESGPRIRSAARRAVVDVEGSQHSSSSRQRLGVRSSVQAMPTNDSPEPIAIVGMSGRFPGARTIAELWQILVEGRDAVQEIPLARFDWRGHYEARGESDANTGASSGKTNSKWLGVLPGVDEFDPLFFEITPKEAQAMDPRQRLLLQESFKALEDAGYGASQLSRQKIGMFVGVEQGDYQLLLDQSGAEGSLTANHDAILASRLSYCLNLHGPAMAINTACSSGLVALHQACLSLRAQECDTAIAASVNLILTPNGYIGMSQAGMLSPDGRCYAFDQRANGMVPGEAVLAIVVKSLSQAQANNDLIYAVIRGSGINYDGKTNGLTAPNGAAQTALFSEVYARSKLRPDEIEYIVTHGTGTRLGDPVEINALRDAFKDVQCTVPFCALTSTKSNVGHTFAASGLVSVVSLVQAMQHEMIPASLHCEQLSDYIDWTRSPFYVNTQNKAWPKRDGKRRIGAVSAFGMSGTNAHVLVESYEQEQSDSIGIVAPCYLLVISAKSVDSLEQRAQDLIAVLQKTDQSWETGGLASMSHVLLHHRQHYGHRCALIVESTEQAIALLGKVSGSEKLPTLLRGKVTRDRSDQPALKSYAEELMRGLPQQQSEALRYRESLAALGDLYCQGYELTGQLYADGMPRRLSLPTYPFSREQYWVELSGMVAEAVEWEADYVVAVEDEVGVGREGAEGAGGRQQEERIKERVLSRLKGVFSEVTGLGVEQIEGEEILESYGIDSIMIVRLNEQLSKVLNGLSKTLFYEYPSLRELRDYLLIAHEADCLRWIGMNGSKEVAGAAIPERTVGSVRRAQQPVRRVKKEGIKEREGIAIIGLSGRYPQANTVHQYWENLKAGKVGIGEIPSERWSLLDFYEADMEKAIEQGKSYSKWGGFVDGFAEFDPLFFNISPVEAINMDPQERMFLQSSWEVLEDAGYTKESLAKQYQGRVGVYAGITKTGFELYGPALRAQGELSYPHTSFSSVANRVSYLLDLHGPSMPIDTMCSASLTAIHEACEHLLRGECELAIAGGVNLYLHPSSYVGLCAQRMLSQDGECKSFGAGGNGFVPGEGVGAVLLKPLSRAIEDHDHIYGVIKGTSINHGGKTNGYTVPNPNAQRELILAALQKAQIDARSISYIEAHGTGTSLGDPIEIAGLTQAFSHFTQERQFCSIGSAKSNIGHLESAAGIAAVTKVLLQMKHGLLAPSLHSKILNPHIDFSSTPFRVQQDIEKWQRPLISVAGVEKEYPRVAGISSFGAGGSNAHVIIEEYCEAVVVEALKPTAPQVALIVLSAKNEARLQEYARQLQAHISSGIHSESSLIHIAYTLQVGRDAMEHRLALTATTFSELQEKLSGYLSGQVEKGEIENCYKGHVKREKDTLSLFAADEELQEAISKWALRGKYGKLLELWVKGLVFDWTTLYGVNSIYGDVKPRRLSLPTYPFARERYWIEMKPTLRLASGGNVSGSVAVLHPLVHRNTSSLSEQRFSSTLSGVEFYLADHVVQGKRVLPGVCYLEMARAAIVASLDAGMVCGALVLKHVVWSQPIVVESEREIHIGLYSHENGEIEFEVYTKSADEVATEIVHAQGRAMLLGESAAGVESIDVRALSTQSTKSIEIAACYALFSSMGLKYGLAHQGLKSMQVGTDQAGARYVLAEVALPDCVSETQAQYVLHPSVLDSALQASIGFVLEALSPQSPVSGVKPALPFALEQLEVIARSPSPAWVYVRVSDSVAGSATGIQKLDIDICDEQGCVCVRVKGFTSRVLASGFDDSRQAGRHVESLLLKREWSKRDIVEAASSVMGYVDRVVCVTGIYKDRLSALESQLPGVKWMVIPDEVSTESFAGIEIGCQVFSQVQTLLQGKPKAGVLFQVVMSAEGASGKIGTALSGLLKSAHQENPKFMGQVITVSPSANGAEIAQVLAENAAEAAQRDAEIRYINGVREVASFKELKAELAVSEAKLPWKDGGVYLITGGAGGLGLIFAQEIVSHVEDARIILTGRSELSSEKQAQIALLQQSSGSGRIEYRVLDIGDFSAVTMCVHAVVEQYGALNGIIHSAGVISDNFIIKKTAEEFRTVLAPKVSGTLNIDRATQAIDLDFLLLFSSTSGVFGNVGQSDYAFANGFMDAYAGYRNELVKQSQRQGRTLSINWPLWASGGMGVDEATQVAMRRFGFEVLATATGVAALYAAWCSDESQVMVLSGDIQKLKELMGLLPSSDMSYTKTLASKTVVTAKRESLTRSSLVSRSELHERTLQYLKRILGVTLKLSPDRIDSEAALEQYGIDSILALKLVNELERAFGSLSKTLMFEYQSIEALSGYFIEHHRDVLNTHLKLTEHAAVTQRVSTDVSETIVVSAASKRRGSRIAAQEHHGGGKVIASQEEFGVAIVGMSGRYPGANCVEEYWENLKSGKDSITEIPSDRWDYREYFDDEKGKFGKSYSKWGGFIAGVDEFDPLFFNISPREAVGMDPQERLFLQCVYHTLEDAGYTRGILKQHRALGLDGNVGVYVGVMYEEYQLYGAQAQVLGQPYALGGNPSSIANRVSYFCNFHGPSVAIDTMCSSSLTAIHFACQALRNKGCEAAIAGGVNVSIHPNKYLGLSQGQFASSTGRCESFGLGGDGYVPGEGVGAVLLKPLNKALADGDHIYGVIKGTSINHGGKTNGYTVPNPIAQAQVIAQALQEAQIDARSISYIEAHGTGTSLGDPIEIAGLTQAFSHFTQERQFCSIGSAKSNIGHLESAAGIAAVTKVLLQMKHGLLAPSLHSKILNPHIDFSSTPFRVQQDIEKWQRPLISVAGVEKEYPRVAGISSFGAGGSNAHVIIEEYCEAVVVEALKPTAPQVALIVLSAKNEARLQEYARQLQAHISSGIHSESSLIHIAYTLQVGRDAMEHRLALTATTFSELQEKLSGYLSGQVEKGEIENCYKGHVKREKDTLSLFAADEELQEAISKWALRGKYGKLLELWVKGLVFDWTTLYGVNSIYGDVKPRRLSLPTYPFARERYWIEMKPTLRLASGGNVSGSVAVLHPLVHRNTSSLSEQRFSSTLSGVEFYLADHVVQGKRVLPGVCYLEMARAAIVASLDAGMVCGALVLKHVVWSQPIVVESEREIHIGLYSHENGEIEFEVYTKSADEVATEIVHAQGRAMLLGESAAGVESIDVRALSTQSTKSIEIAACYALFSSMGLKYGLAHQGLKSMQVGTDQAGARYVLAEVALPDCVSETQAQYVLHPSVLDSALQASIGFVLEALSPQSPVSGVKPALPFALEQLEVIARSPSPAWVYVRVSDSVAGSATGIQKLDIDICDEQGCVCVRVKGFTSRVLASGFDDSRQAGRHVESLLLKREWSKRDIVEAASSVMGYVDRVVCVTGIYKDRLSALESQLPGVKWMVIPDEVSTESFAGIEIGCQVFSQVQTLLQGKPKAGVLFQVVMSAEGASGKIGTALSGLLKSAHQENPKFMGQVITVSPSANGAEIAQVLAENAAEAAQRDAEIRYINGVREVASFKELKAELAVSEAKLPWKDGGVYLITGGAGGLGLIFAQEIVSHVEDARIILTGRSELSSEKQAQIALLQQSSGSGRIEYRVLDIGDFSAVTMCVHAVVEQYGALNGIIHSAGVISDNFIIKKTAEEFRTVLAPKVSGTLNIDRATQAIDLDFLLLFSSTSGVFGNVGQSDYAFANGFMDAYAGYRNELVKQSQRQGRTLSINWPLWASGGMGVDEATQVAMRRFGFEVLATATGVAALYAAWRSDESQVMVLSGDIQKLKELMGLLPSSTIRVGKNTDAIRAYVSDATSVAAETSSSMSADDLTEKVERALIQVISQQLAVKESDIDVRAELSEFGFDSITLTTFSNVLNQTYRFELSPTIFFEYQTVRSFATYLVAEHLDLVERNFGRQARGASVEGNSLPEGHIPLTAKSAPAVVTRVNRRSQLTSIKQTDQGSEPIAIIGMSGRFPGADDLNAFWENLKGGRQCITEIPPARWDWHSIYGDPIKENNKTNIKWGGFIRGLEEFDPLFFNISPTEAELMDPQQRLLMMYAWKTIEDAGYSAESLSGSKTAIFVGTASSGYGDLIAKATAATRGFSSTGAVTSMGPNRVSYFLNLHGSSEPIDTACSSSLVAIHRAIRAMQSGDCELALVGGINTIITPWAHISFGRAGMLSVDGRCKTFSQDANGYVRGEGIGILFLKKLSAAESDGDHIYGLIKGSSVTHGGHAASLTAPNPRAQAETIKCAVREAKIDPETITYVEVHGTATPLGDPIEINGLKMAFKELCSNNTAVGMGGGKCGLGSVKTHIGHLEIASGVASVISVLLQMKHRLLIKNPTFGELNPHIDIKNTQFYVVRENEFWQETRNADGKPLPRRAGVSAFGFGGVNAHIVLEEYVPLTIVPASNVVDRVTSNIILLSAKNADRLKEVAKLLAAAIRTQQLTDLSIARIAYTLQVGRDAMEERLAFTVSSIEVLLHRLDEYVDGAAQEGMWFRGSTASGMELPALLQDRKELESMVASRIAEGKPEEILELWVNGLTVDWNQFYSGTTKPKRVSLPTYPFLAERYWYCGHDERIDAHIPAILDDTPHPVVTPAFQSSRLNITRNNPRVGMLARVVNNAKNVDSSSISGLEKIGYELKRIIAIQKRSRFNKIDVTLGFIEMGLTSYEMLQLVLEIENALKVRLSPLVLFEYPTFEGLKHHLYNTYGTKCDSLIAADFDWSEVSSDFDTENNSSFVSGATTAEHVDSAKGDPITNSIETCGVKEEEPEDFRGFRNGTVSIEVMLALMEKEGT